jgi:hypoxanthine phosphoribosyltransferase
MNKELYLSERKIQKILKRISEEINIRYKDKDITFIIILDGAIRFGSDILSLIDNNGSNELYTIKLKSYENNKSTNKINPTDDTLLKIDLEGKNVIILEDIIDSGLTMNYLHDVIIKYKNPKSYLVCSLFGCLESYNYETIIGIHKDDQKFIFGYGLDFDNKYRDENNIFYKSD